MTTLYDEEQTCALCGTKSEQTSIGSTNSFGSPDLDLRPSEMQRSTMAYWVQECPDCGYAHRSIEEMAPHADMTLTSGSYRAILSGTLNGSLMGRFLKASLVSEGASDTERAGDYALNAAWVADDAADPDGAITYRNRALNLFVASLVGADETSEQSIVTRVLLVDILRRAARWQEAIDLADVLLELELEATIRAVLEFGRSAASKQDGNCYTIQKALAD